MNNEEIKEAIETLERNYPFDRYVQLKKAVDVAIEALHTVDSPILTMKRLGEFQADAIMQSGKDTDVPVTDCISRQQALALEKELMVNERGYEKYNHGLNSYRTRLMSLPSAEPERKKGKWIDKSGGIEGAWNYCSVCGEQAIDLYDFCPNCGADMRGEHDGR